MSYLLLPRLDFFKSNPNPMMKKRRSLIKMDSKKSYFKSDCKNSPLLLEKIRLPLFHLFATLKYFFLVLQSRALK